MQIRMLLAGLFLRLSLPSLSEDVPMFGELTTHWSLGLGGGRGHKVQQLNGSFTPAA